jgi:hypothetical protein
VFSLYAVLIYSNLGAFFKATKYSTVMKFVILTIERSLHLLKLLFHSYLFVNLIFKRFFLKRI